MTSDRFRARVAHLLAEAQSERSTPRWQLGRHAFRRGRVLVAGPVLAAAVAAAPALAFSSTVRNFVGLSSASPPPQLVAKLTGAWVHGSRARPGTPVTVTFTIGEAGKQPGTGIPPGSAFRVLLVSRLPVAPYVHLASAYGRNGYFKANTVVPPGGIADVQIGGFLGGRQSPGTLRNAGFWLPIVVLNNPY